MKNKYVSSTNLPILGQTKSKAKINPVVIKPKGPCAWLLYIKNQQLLIHLVDFTTKMEIGYLMSCDVVETEVTHYDYRQQHELITIGVKDTQGNTLDLLLNKSEFRGFLDRSVTEPSFVHLSDPRFQTYGSFIARLLSIDLATYAFLKVDHVYVTNKLENEPSGATNDNHPCEIPKRISDTDAPKLTHQNAVV